MQRRQELTEVWIVNCIQTDNLKPVGRSVMHSIAWWLTLFVVAVATLTDLRSRRIPNWLVLPYLVLGFVVSGWLYGAHGIVQSLAGLAVGGFLFGILSLMGGMGMG